MVSASSECPICGKNTPHHHNEREQAWYRLAILALPFLKISTVEDENRSYGGIAYACYHCWGPQEWGGPVDENGDYTRRVIRHKADCPMNNAVEGAKAYLPLVEKFLPKDSDDTLPPGDLTDTQNRAREIMTEKLGAVQGWRDRTRPEPSIYVDPASIDATINHLIAEGLLGGGAAEREGWRDIEPVILTDEVIDVAAQRLASFGDDSVWPDSWDRIDVAQMRIQAGRVIRSALVAMNVPFVGEDGLDAPPAMIQDGDKEEQ